MKVAIYAPEMCCSSGLCGPAIDPVLVRVNDAVLALKRQGSDVERFDLAQRTPTPSLAIHLPQEAPSP